jgi:hypothetical protein
MSTLRVLASPRVWGPVLGVVAVRAGKVAPGGFLLS